jgi:hypothetical protein
MRTSLTAFALLCVGLLTLTGCDAASSSPDGLLHDDVLNDDFVSVPPPGTLAAARGTSWAGVAPRLIEGNIGGGAEGVCSDERVVGAGNSYSGVKVEAPAPGTYTVGDFMYRLDPTGRGMGFRNIGDSDVRHVVVKGGPDIHVYDYDGTVTQDGRLIPPKNPGGDCPEISWFTICYTE